ncbi:hypothetical protein [Litorihabitans aurantiacus]|uniref:Uncharacterized protein n=1 Tax=Litorihabitans aurantiacus TaxID=1930061 RepID=A0AA37XGF7_9MICO|nr:hypothetical protein [Litorihabitans aurantiacus]GMA32895.1 hypothetical protein GCM10025875_28870 [Litorihabitans aurantiacus]
MRPTWPDGVEPPRLLAPPWWGSGATLTGAALGTAGLQMPHQKPEQACLLHVTEVVR